MTDDIEALVAGSSARNVLAHFAPLDEKARRAHAEPVRRLFRQCSDLYFGGTPKNGVKLRDLDALSVAVLATATRADLRRYSIQIVPRKLPLDEVMRMLAPAWLGDWVEELVEDNAYAAKSLAPLWRAGLCPRPTSDNLILAYYDNWSDKELAADPEFLEQDVWRFFEVEGGGDLSLASHDKYRPQKAWTAYLLNLVEAGKLDRGRLLDSSLDALERDFGQFRAGWYSRFHIALAPSLEEQAARRDRYLHLLSSAVPPTVALALKALTEVDKAGRLEADELLTAISPALLSRQKSTALAALKLLAAAAKRAPSRSAEIAVTALAALVSESAEVQEKALDLVDRLGEGASPGVQAILAEYRDIVAPSVRRRLSGMLAEPMDLVIAEVELDEPAAETVPFPPIAPCGSIEEALELYLAVLEDPRDPIAVERAVDGLSRFGRLASPGSAQLSPLAKRAGQFLSKRGCAGIKLALAACGQAWCSGGKPSEVLLEACRTHGLYPISEHELAATFLRRCDEVLARICGGHALPLMSLPSDGSGQVAPVDLVDRLDQYRRAGITPCAVDLALAFTRLAREGRAQELDRVAGSDEIARVVAFALGAGDSAAGDSSLWASAWAARCGNGLGVPPRWPSKDVEPDGGVPAQYELIVKPDEHSSYFCHAAVAVAPKLRRADPNAPASLLHYRTDGYWHTTACGSDAFDIAWAALIRPADPEAFLASAVRAIDTTQKLADHPCIAYLDAFDRLPAEPGPIGYAVLALYLAAEDKAVCAHAMDKVARLIERRCLAAGAFADAILPFMLVGVFPSKRWTRSLSAVAEISPAHRRAIRDVVAGLMRFEPAHAPRDIGSMIELLYQLQLDCAAPFEDARAIACLERLGGGGSAAKFSNKLLALQRG